jgi:hypothetical protein
MLPPERKATIEPLGDQRAFAAPDPIEVSLRSPLPSASICRRQRERDMPAVACDLRIGDARNIEQIH